MATFHSICPGCNADVKSVYGDQGEGLISRDGCRCDGGRLALGDLVVMVLSGMVILLMVLG
jgi:hypothetical protein